MADFLLERCPGSRTLVVAFTSYGFDRRPPTFPEWHGVLNPVATNRLFLIDHAQHWFHGGVRGFSGSVEETCGRIADYMAELGADRLVVLGSSMGGYAAAVHGAALQADVALLFAPNTIIERQWWLANTDNRRGHKIKEVDEAGYKTLDVPAMFLQGQRPRETIAFFDDLAEWDALHATRLVDLCDLYVVPGAGHEIGKALARSGELETVLRAAVGGRSLTAVLDGKIGRYIPRSLALLRSETTQLGGGTGRINLSEVMVRSRHESAGVGSGTPRAAISLS